MYKHRTTYSDETVAQLLAVDARNDWIRSPAPPLNVCRACGSRLVHPTWVEASGDSWQVALRCPSCEWSHVGCFDHSLVEQLDRELARGEAELEAALFRLTHAIMVDEIDRFVRALAADAIEPFDF